MKKISIILLSFILLIIIIFWLWYLKRYMYDLKETNPEYERKSKNETELKIYYTNLLDN